MHKVFFAAQSLCIENNIMATEKKGGKFRINFHFLLPMLGCVSTEKCQT
jgi:hypothetical protein